MAMTIQTILTPVTSAQVRASMVSSLILLGIPANQWVPGGVASSMLTVAAQVLAMLSGQLSNGLQSFFLPTATTLAVQLGDTGLLSLLAQYVYGVTVPQATFASGTLTLTNSGGGVYNITPGGLTALDSATNVTFQSTNTAIVVVLANTSIDIAVQCTVPGSAGNAAAGAINALVTALLGVTCTNTVALVGIDAPSANAIQALCIASLGARSVRGPRSAYAYAIMTATNSVTGAPVNVNRWTVPPSSHTGIVSIVVCGPAGTTDANDVAGIITSIEGLGTAPFGGARPDAVTVHVVAADTVPYARTITPYVLAPSGVYATVIQSAIVAQLLTFMSSQYGNPIGGVAAQDDAGALTGLFATGVYGAIAQGVSSIPGCALISAKGAGPDLLLSPGQVATNDVVVNMPILVRPGT